MKKLIIIFSVFVIVATVFLFVGFLPKNNLTYNATLQVIYMNKTCSAKPMIYLKYRLNLERNGEPIKNAKVTERVYNYENVAEGYSDTEFHFDEKEKIWKNDVIYCLKQGRYYSKIMINVLEKEAIKKEII
ncbi:MAG: hypothetical protein QW040_01265, partial [Candidatus Aenigmatarchaeota archaeon]